MPRTFVIIQIVIAAVALPAAFVLWFAFVRQVPERTGSAVIRAKTFLDAHTVTRYPSNIFRQSWTPTAIRINEAYVFDLSVDGVGETHFAMDTTSSNDFQVDQKVAVRYEVRGLGPIWRLIRIKGIETGAL